MKITSRLLMLPLIALATGPFSMSAAAALEGHLARQTILTEGVVGAGSSAAFALLSFSAASCMLIATQATGDPTLLLYGAAVSTGMALGSLTCGCCSIGRAGIWYWIYQPERDD